MKVVLKYVLIVIPIIVALYFIYSGTPGEYDDFANCLSGKAVMYGTDRCGACQSQKDLFGKSFENIDYRNCDNLGQECRDKEITGYPTWRINNTNYPGLQTLATLASLTGCNL